ncbi:hypothetical protein TNCV_169111 [Trichonephila clavipes]|nr:hypothetical protein TNCV_169111 [Trichonephila clavipes]
MVHVKIVEAQCSLVGVVEQFAERSARTRITVKGHLLKLRLSVLLGGIDGNTYTTRKRNILPGKRKSFSE